MIAGTIRNAVNQMQLVNDWEQKKATGDVVTWILGNVTRIPRHELPQTLDFSDFLPLFT